MEGRIFRAIIGTLVIVVDLGVLVVNHVVRAGVVWEVKELAFHGVFLILGLLLVDPKAAKQAVDTIAPYIPFARKK